MINNSIAQKYLLSDLFLLAVNLIVFIGWYTKLFAAGLILLSIIAVFILLTQKNTLPVLAILLSVVYMVPKYSGMQKIDFQIIVCGVFILLAVCAGVYNFIKFKKERRYSLGSLFYYLVAIFVAGALGGLGYVSVGDFFIQGAIVLGAGAAIIALYLLAHNTMELNKPEQKVFFAKIFVYISVTVLFETAVNLSRFGNIVAAINWKMINLGWGGSNTVATVLMFSIPFSLYLALNYKYGGFFVPLAIVQYAAIFITHSRGCILFSSVFMVIGAVYVIKNLNKTNKKIALASYGAFLAVGLVFATIFFDKFYALFEQMINKKLTDAGRFDLYKEAVIDWFNNPVFGLSFFYKISPDFIMYWYHNPICQLLNNLGIVGIIPFIFFYVKKYKIIFSGIKSTFGFAVFGYFLVMELYGFIDVLMFIPYFAVGDMFLLVALQKNVERKTADCQTI